MHTPAAQSAADAMAHERARLRTAGFKPGEYETLGVRTRYKNGQPFISFSIFPVDEANHHAHQYVRVTGATWSEAFERAHNAIPGAVANMRAEIGEAA